MYGKTSTSLLYYHTYPLKEILIQKTPNIVVIFSVPFTELESVCKKLHSFVSPHALIVDVTSVKQKPITILKKYFPNHEILGTHQILRPQLGKNDIAGLPIVLCNVSLNKPKSKESTKNIFERNSSN